MNIFSLTTLICFFFVIDCVMIINLYVFNNTTSTNNEENIRENLHNQSQQKNTFSRFGQYNIGEMRNS